MNDSCFKYYLAPSLAPSLTYQNAAWSPTPPWLLVLHTPLLSPGILLGRREAH